MRRIWLLILFSTTLSLVVGGFTYLAMIAKSHRSSASIRRGRAVPSRARPRLDTEARPRLVWNPGLSFWDAACSRGAICHDFSTVSASVPTWTRTFHCRGSFLVLPGFLVLPCVTKWE